MSEATCRCCELPLYSCGVSAQRKQAADQAAERRRLLALPDVLPALYPGTCTACHERFPAGAPIIREHDHIVINGPAPWRCLECCPTEEGPRR